MANANNGTVSRGAMGGGIAITAVVTGLSVAFLSQLLSGPAEVSGIKERLMTAEGQISEIAGKQDNVRERLTVVEAGVTVAGEDRWYGREARMFNAYITERIEETRTRVERLEAYCFDEGYRPEADGRP